MADVQEEGGAIDKGGYAPKNLDIDTYLLDLIVLNINFSKLN